MKVSKDHPLVVLYSDYDRPSPNAVRQYSGLLNQDNNEAERDIASTIDAFVVPFATPGKPKKT